ncbi:MAG: GNAT family N-acetyltransferase [Candidatus Heimdallarchaeota archaeon]
MLIRLIDKQEHELLEKCRKKAGISYLDNLVLLGDLHSPCIDLTRIYGLFDTKDQLQNFFVIFDGFVLPSVVLPVKMTNSIFCRMMDYLLNILPHEFIILSLELLEKDLTDFVKVNRCAKDNCMAINNDAHLTSSDFSFLKKVQKNDYDRINIFYKTIDTSPWNPIQLESNFYHFIEVDNEIVACGGTHFETPKLAQLGNIYVLEEHRRKGYGSILTSAITRDILSKKDYATLFVYHENYPAIALYEKLGYKLHKPARLFFCEKKMIRG